MEFSGERASSIIELAFSPARRAIFTFRFLPLPRTSVSLWFAAISCLMGEGLVCSACQPCNSFWFSSR
jgi:hypothetical protein